MMFWLNQDNMITLHGCDNNCTNKSYSLVFVNSTDLVLGRTEAGVQQAHAALQQHRLLGRIRIVEHGLQVRCAKSGQ